MVTNIKQSSSQILQLIQRNGQVNDIMEHTAKNDLKKNGYKRQSTER